MSEPSLLTKPLERMTRGLVRGRFVVLAISLIVVIAAVLVTWKWLGFRTSRLDLLSPHSEYNQRWLDYLAEFGDDDDVLVLVAGADASAVEPALEAIEAELERNDSMFERVLARSDLSRLRPKALHFIPEPDLRGLVAYVDAMEPLAHGDVRKMSVAAGLSQAFQGGGDPRARDAALAWLRSLRQSLDDQAVDAPLGDELRPLMERFAEFRSRPLLENQGRLGICALKFVKQPQELVRNAVPIERLRGVIADIQSRHPNVRIGATGMPLLEFDEMASSQRDMTLSSLFSLVGVVLFLMLGYGNLRYSLLAFATLLFGMAWSFGFVTLVVGHLNLLSISFAVILIGLGIDFGIHYLARFCQSRSQGATPLDAILDAARAVGPGVVTGAVTTACAFFAAGLTEFVGVAELGIVAGAGILVCLLAALVVLPPLVVMIDERWPIRMNGAALGLEPLLARLGSRPGWLVLGTLVLTALATPGVMRLRYDHNLLNLQPERVDSVVWEHVLMDESDRSVWFAVSMADSPEDLLRLKRRFESLKTVDRIEEIVTLRPRSSPESQGLIRDLHERLARLPARVPLLPAFTAEELGRELGRMGPELSAGLASDPELGRLFGEIQQRLMALSPAESSRRLSAWRQRATESAWAGLKQLTEFADPSPPNAGDLDESLTSRFVSGNGRHLLRVYAKGSIWDREALTRFVREVESVDPRVTGHPIQTYYASGQMQQSYLHAAMYAFFAVLIVLMIDFQSLRLSLIAYSPLLVGVWLLLGLLGWLDIPFNAANMIVLPLILGIGIDNGVHVVHDWRSQSAGAYRLSPSVGVAMLLCSSTTMVGFCSMIFARHQGLRTLGQVLTLGIVCCLATSLGFLPAVLKLRDRRRPGTGQTDLSRGETSALADNRQGVEENAQSGDRQAA
jgi:hopanoid biosynthesis associated RND transporter like protein HpnN